MIGPRPRATLVLLFVFAAGMFAGVAVDRHVLNPSAVLVLGSPEEYEAAMTDLIEVVGLDDRQIRQVHEILANRQATVQAMWEQLRPEVQGAMLDVHADIAALLRPDQVERFHEWLASRGGHHPQPQH